LHQKDGFEWRFPMSIQELVDKFLVELAGNNFGSAAFPPIRFMGAVMKTDATKLARVGEHKRAFALKQNEMIVFPGSMIRGRDPNLAGHAEMNSKPVVSGKFEEHPFAPRKRAEKFRADQALLELAYVAAAKDAVSCVQAKTDNLRAAPGVPLFAKPFDFGQLGHRADYAARRVRSKVDRPLRGRC
jgi:hypothetical protein